MDLLEGIQSRTSAKKLDAPAPSAAHLEQIVRAGTRAPDHGRLRPWRFTVFEGAAREKLGDAMANCLRSRVPNSLPEHLDAERGKAMRAPLVMVVGAKISKGKIPEIEQVSAVSAAIQNMLLAAHALGYGAMWKTGAAAYDPAVKELCGLAPEDHIVGIVYLGTVTSAGPLVEAPIEIKRV
ncbi:MAG TPA: nitroreductase [Steroidobacter sp.]|uniref:nitroreductase family protein n=1 Tax=Steroidobacter sp. TaxID=1978227 RepID=UPI002ED9C13D